MNGSCFATKHVPHNGGARTLARARRAKRAAGVDRQ